MNINNRLLKILSVLFIPYFFNLNIFAMKLCTKYMCSSQILKQKDLEMRILIGIGNMCLCTEDKRTEFKKMCNNNKITIEVMKLIDNSHVNSKKCEIAITYFYIYEKRKINININLKLNGHRILIGTSYPSESWPAFFSCNRMDEQLEQYIKDWLNFYKNKKKSIKTHGVVRMSSRRAKCNQQLKGGKKNSDTPIQYTKTVPLSYGKNPTNFKGCYLNNKNKEQSEKLKQPYCKPNNRTYCKKRPLEEHRIQKDEIRRSNNLNMQKTKTKNIKYKFGKELVMCKTNAIPLL